MEEGKFNIYTDLIVESQEIKTSDNTNSYDGVEISIFEEDFFKTTLVKITNENGEKLFNKKIGTYVTIESQLLKENDKLAHESITIELANYLKEIHKLNKNSKILVVGLGNWNITPDALGPKVINKLLVTNHIGDVVPKELQGTLRGVSAISPGVMGITGIETKEIVKGVVDRINPDLVIAIDALAARETTRVNATIQISNTGIAPGSGMGNKRLGLNMESLGVPVIAIGVPTVVDAATLVNDSLDLLLGTLIEATEEGSEFYEMLINLGDTEKYSLIKNVLDEYMGSMFVTPKEVDAVINRLSGIIANALNVALHDGISEDDINRFLY